VRFLGNRNLENGRDPSELAASVFDGMVYCGPVVQGGCFRNMHPKANASEKSENGLQKLNRITSAMIFVSSPNRSLTLRGIFELKYKSKSSLTFCKSGFIARTLAECLPERLRMNFFLC